jgi:hypothetical protein
MASLRLSLEGPGHEAVAATQEYRLGACVLNQENSALFGSTAGIMNPPGLSVDTSEPWIKPQEVDRGAIARE